MNECMGPEAMLARHRLAVAEDPRPSLRHRRRDLRALARTLRRRAPDLVEALSSDFGGRGIGDSVYGDLFASLGSIRYARTRLRRWMRPERRHAWPPQPGRCRVIHEPLGTVGIVVPWNFPVYLAFAPLTGALAAGNRIMLKLSEYTPATNRIMREICDEAVGDRITVCEGGPEFSEAFCRLPFDHLLFTGSLKTGRAVYRYAAENMTPVTLELGGKSPVLFAPGVSVRRSVNQTILGKCINAGQTCVSPDYLLCPLTAIDEVAGAFAGAYRRMYPQGSDSPDWTRIINNSHRQRLQRLLDDAHEKGADIRPLAEPGSDESAMPLTLVFNVTDDMALMHEEIFGPVLPVIGYDNLDDALAFITARPEPLALYAFTHDRALQARILAGTRSGSVGFNEVATHALQEDLPFGGTGASGMGRYHGIDGFRTFSNRRAVFDRGRFGRMSTGFPPWNRPLHRWIFRALLGRAGAHGVAKPSRENESS